LGHHDKDLDHPFHQLVDSLNAMAADLGRLEVMRQEFIANVSHEIQSPLASIAGFTRIIKAGTVTAAQQGQYLDIIHAESDRLSRLTDNLLQLAALESGVQPVRHEPVAVDRQIRDGIIALEPVWSAKGLVLDVDLPPLRVMADPDWLHHVWINLLTNAFKFTPDGGAIRLAGECTNGMVTASVTDSGIGMSSADQARIFERFFKSDRARTRTTPGSGLGLAIVKKIVDLHGGTITVDSILDHGTTVTIQLPEVP
jgi:signal transduction histidine kinase